MMSRKQNKWFVITLVLAAVVALTSATATYSYANWQLAEERYQTTLTSLQDLSYTVNVLIKSGADQMEWYNDTRIPIGWSFYNATDKITNGNVEGIWSEFGVFVTAINGVEGNGPQYWIWFTWDEATKQWTSGATGTDVHILRQNEIVAWYLTDDWMATP
ncbi:MAG: hypothetical protein NWE83_00605 [Candidatus Bathyarchaeota archaeon]|nr:hypothetical protein [Candidatus Bathyarchaeota archaeon]